MSSSLYRDGTVFTEPFQSVLLWKISVDLWCGVYCCAHPRGVCGGQRLTLTCLPWSPLHWFYVGRVSLDLKFAVSVNLTQNPGTRLSLLPQCRAYRFMPPCVAFAWVLGFWTQVLVPILCSKPSPGLSCVSDFFKNYFSFFFFTFFFYFSFAFFIVSCLL